MDLLFVHWNMNPEIFRIGSFAVRWYGLLFVSGFVIGYWMFARFFKREKVNEALLDPLLYTLLIGTLVGARLGHCIFYQPDYYFGSWKGFLEIFAVWHGGLASHGGAMMLLLCMWWFANKYGKKNHIDFLWILDHLAIAVAFAATFIRLGNLCNSEIYGDVTNLPWGFVFERRGGDRAEASDPDLRGAELSDPRCRAVVALCQEAGQDVQGFIHRNILHRLLRDAFPHRVHQGASGGFREHHGA